MDKSLTTTKIITGLVVDGVSGRGLGNIRIEAWPPGEASISIASSETDAEGKFQLAIDKERLKEAVPGRQPRLLFRIFREGEGEPLLGVLTALGNQLMFEVSLPTGTTGETSALPVRNRQAATRRETPTLIDTGIRYNPQRVYRLVGRDLYSAPAGGPLAKGEYIRLRAGVISELDRVRSWRVVMRGGRVWLTTA